jgi:hypothetical protein
MRNGSTIPVQLYTPLFLLSFVMASKQIEYKRTILWELGLASDERIY